MGTYKNVLPFAVLIIQSIRYVVPVFPTLLCFCLTTAATLVRKCRHFSCVYISQIFVAALLDYLTFSKSIFLGGINCKKCKLTFRSSCTQKISTSSLSLCLSLSLSHTHTHTQSTPPHTHTHTLCGCFGNMCICIYCVLYCLYCVFVLFRVCVFHSYLFCLY
jgi:hypothetical protein